MTDFPASLRLSRLVFALPFSRVSTPALVYTSAAVLGVEDSSTRTASAAVATPNPPQRRESAIRDARRERLVTPPNFFRACSRLRVRASDFRRYHIAILCLGPDDFVDVVHDDFPLCENNEHFLRAGCRSFLCPYITGNLSLAVPFAAKVVEILQKWSF